MPQVAQPGHDPGAIGLGRRNFIGIVLNCRGKQRLQFAANESCEIQIKVGLEFENPAEFKTEQLVIPSRQFSETIVGNDIGAPVRFAHPLDRDHRNPLHPDCLGRGHAAVPGDNPVSAIDKHWIEETESANARLDLLELTGRMRPGVVGVGHERPDCPILHAADV